MGSGFLLRSLRALLALGLMLAAAAPAYAAPLHTDADRDGVYDDLESRVQSVDRQRELRVIVTLGADATAERARRLENRVDSLEVGRRFAVVDALVAVVDAGDVRSLAAAPGVAQVEPDTRVHATNASAQQSFGVTEARLDMPSLDGAGLTAAVIDTGIDTGHVDLNGAGKVLAFQDFTDGSWSDSDTPFDPNGHGTHVSATIAGEGDGGPDGRGVAPAASLVGLKVLDANGEGWSSDILGAIDWVWKDPDGGGPALPNGVAYGIDAINMSLGGAGCSDGRDAESRAVNNASNAGYVVAVAAGNDGKLGGCTGTTGISTPAAAEKAITVAAMADVGVGGFYLADFSSRGPTLDGRVKPDVSAPGVSVTSAKAGTTNGYATYSGTSMATPFVVGVSLLMRQLNPLLTPDQVKQKIMETAVDWGSIGTDNDYGAGRLDAYAALEAAPTSPSTALSSPPTGLPVYQRAQSSLAGTGATRTFTVTAQGGFPLALGLTVGSSGADFDMYLRDSSGTQVAKAESPYRQDALHLSSPTGGPYTLQVVSYSGSGSFFLDVSGAVATGDGIVTSAANTRAPAITGKPAVGSTLTADPGDWTGDPELSYEWQRCASGPADCTSTRSQGASYSLGAADEGHGIRVAVTGTNAGGSGTVYSPVVSVPYRPPAVSGAPTWAPGDFREDSTVEARAATWDTSSGLQPITALAQSWERCDSAGGSCTAIPGASGLRYTITADDVGSKLRYVETATNAGGSTSASTPLSDVIAEGLRPPALVTAPEVTGPARHGGTLRLSQGTWTGFAPFSYAYEWLRCDADGGACSVMPAATEARYVPTAKDVGSRILGRVVASNAAGPSSADASSEPLVKPARPENRRRPAIRGQAVPGATLRARRGAWWGTPTLTFAVRWLRCNDGVCHRIKGATGSAYVPTTADLGSRLRARVVATNAAGHRKAVSRRTGRVKPAFVD